MRYDQPLLLIAEDDEQMRDLMVQTLTPGYGIFLAHDGQQAIDFYMQMGERISTVVADVDLPLLSGAALTTWLLAQSAPPPVILLSEGQSPDTQAAKQLFAKAPKVHWLEKPFPMRKLRDLVQETARPAPQASCKP